MMIDYGLADLKIAAAIEVQMNSQVINTRMLAKRRVRWRVL